MWLPSPLWYMCSWFFWLANSFCSCCHHHRVSLTRMLCRFPEEKTYNGTIKVMGQPTTLLWSRHKKLDISHVTAEKTDFSASYSLWWRNILQVIPPGTCNKSGAGAGKCNISDVQGETDGKADAVLPFARARHKAVRQPRPHVTTRAISNVACQYEHTTPAAAERCGWLSLVGVYSQRESAFYHGLWFLRCEPISSCVSDVADMEKADVV